MEGVVNVLKPPGMTSSDVVSEMRHIFSMKRVGHTGTLDPGAAGVLPVCLGRATRLFDHLTDKEKEYIAEIAFGVETDTQDSYGAVVRQMPAQVTMASLQAVLGSFTGELLQTVPLYAAVRVNGKPMYKLARAGEAVEQKKRTVTIHALELLSQTAENRFLLRVRCARGTYVRALCSDIGAKLDTCAHLSFLLRTRSSAFTLENAFALHELRALKEKNMLHTAVVSVDDALEGYPAFDFTELSEREERLLLNGAHVDPPNGIPLGKLVKTYLNGRFLGLGARGDGGFHMSVFFTGDQLDGK